MRQANQEPLKFEMLVDFIVIYRGALDQIRQRTHQLHACASGEMADAPDLGSGPVRGGGSSPLSRTNPCMHDGVQTCPNQRKQFSTSNSTILTEC